MATLRDVAQTLAGERLVTKAVLIYEAVDPSTGDPWLVVVNTDNMSAWDREGFLRYATRLALVESTEGDDDE